MFVHHYCPGDEGAALLAQKLSGNGLLVTLDVGSNGIGDVGAAALAEGLKLNTTLQKIDLRCEGSGVELVGLVCCCAWCCSKGVM